MPTHNDVVDSDAFTDPAKVITDGTDYNSANTLLMVQPLANRTRNLKNRLDRKARMVADIAALKALGASVREEGDLVFLLDTNRLYIFDADSAVSTAEPFAAVPSSGSGRWLLVRSGNTIYSSGALTASEATTSSTTYVDVTNTEITFDTNAAVGDRLEFELSYHQKSNNAAAYSSLRVVSTENGGGVIQITPYDIQTTATSYANEAVHACWSTIGTAGQVKVKVQHLISNASYVSAVRALSFKARLIKP